METVDLDQYVMPCRDAFPQSIDVMKENGLLKVATWASHDGHREKDNVVQTVALSPLADHNTDRWEQLYSGRCQL